MADWWTMIKPHVDGIETAQRDALLALRNRKLTDVQGKLDVINGGVQTIKRIAAGRPEGDGNVNRPEGGR
jgi:tRNA1(Val) A37 N6-methylase TrmN6